MGVPKRRPSKMKIRQRVASHRHRQPVLSTCPNCNNAKQPHRVCGGCGYYGDRQVLTIKSDA